MGIVDLCYHYYSKHFAPEVVPLTFVDNIGVLAEQANQLLHGTLVLQEFLSLWKLDMDVKKSWTWCTNRADVNELHTLGYDVRTEAGDLGVQHSYTGHKRVGVQLLRLHALEHLWGKLRKLDADLTLKQHILVTMFWPKAFHGISVCLLGKNHIDSLRTQALKALGHGRAGAAPLMRMLLGTSLLCDPGYYQLQRVLCDFRRMSDKQDEVLHLWTLRWNAYTGTVRAGPFSKLLEVLEAIQWRILEPPWVQPHEGYPIDLLAVPQGVLEDLLTSAWSQG